MTKEEWIERELAKMPPRSEAWREETRRLWGLKAKSGNPVNLNKVRVETATPGGTVDDDGADVAA